MLQFLQGAIMAKKRYYSKGQHANTPTESFMRAYPRIEYVNIRPYGDTLEYVDMEMNSNVKKSKTMPPKRRG